MRSGVDQEWMDALEARGIRTALLAWFDFKSEPVAVWTGTTSIMPLGTGDSLLDGITFEPMAHGVPVQIGDNTFNYSGSEELELSLALPTFVPEELVAASMDAEEYQGRTAIMWRALMVTMPNATTPAEWSFRRIRAGTLDNLRISNDGENHFFTISIEAHASMITNASASSYLDQEAFDPTDFSQRYAVSIANNPRTPGGVSAPTSVIGSMWSRGQGS